MVLVTPTDVVSLFVFQNRVSVLDYARYEPWGDVTQTDIVSLFVFQNRVSVLDYARFEPLGDVTKTDVVTLFVFQNRVSVLDYARFEPWGDEWSHRLRPLWSGSGIHQVSIVFKQTSQFFYSRGFTVHTCTVSQFSYFCRLTAHTCSALVSSDLHYSSHM